MPADRTAKTEIKEVGKHLNRALGAFGRLAKVVATDAARGASQATRAACEKTLAALDRLDRQTLPPGTAPETPAVKREAPAARKAKPAKRTGTTRRAAGRRGA